jgi:hypothetical protein
MNRQQKLEHFAERELKRNIKNLIVDDDEGGYAIFGNYHLKETERGFEVSNWETVIHVFGSKRAAVSWCVADKYRQYQLAFDILTLDRKKQLLGADIHCRRTLGERSRQESFYEIVNTKLANKLNAYDLVNSELEKCISRAKYLQLRGFSNEA